MTTVKRATKAPAKTSKTAAPKAAETKAATAATAAEGKEAVPVKKAPARKAPVKKEVKPAETEASVYVQYAGKQIAAKEILEAAKAAYVKAHKDTEVKTIEIYVKPEEAVAYYVVNGEGSDDYKIEL